MGGGTDTKIRAQKKDHGEENSPTAPAGTRTHDLSVYPNISSSSHKGRFIQKRFKQNSSVQLSKTVSKQKNYSAEDVPCIYTHAS